MCFCLLVNKWIDWLIKFVVTLQVHYGGYWLPDAPIVAYIYYDSNFFHFGRGLREKCTSYIFQYHRIESL